MIKIGGVNHVIGGWGEYEINKRNARWNNTKDRPKIHYPNRTYISSMDVVQSVLSHHKQSFSLSLDELSNEMKHIENIMVAHLSSKNYINIPPLTSNDIKNITSIDTYNINNLLQLSKNIDKIANYYCSLLENSNKDSEEQNITNFITNTQNIPDDYVNVENDDEVIALEEKVVPYIEEIEKLQSKISLKINKVIDILRERKKEGGNMTRGNEIDIYAKTPPKNIVDKGLPFSGNYYFKIVNGNVVTTTLNESIYYGICKYNEDKSRTTLLTPECLKFVSFYTSGRFYSWVVIDSPELCCAIRMNHSKGNIVEISSDDILEWITPRLYGNPPHKLIVKDYLKYLRKLGFIVYEGVINDTELRFDIKSMKSEATRKAEIKKLSDINILELDWSDFDKKLSSLPCSFVQEISGDIILKNGKLIAPKIRNGNLWSSMPHNRSLLNFHSHPSYRYNGNHYEPPSEADLIFILSNCTSNILAWHFIISPEGTYIIRASELLKNIYLKNPHEILTHISTLYKHKCSNSVISCINSIMKIINEIGFVAHFRYKPCIKLSEVPDILPLENQRITKSFEINKIKLSQMTPESLLKLKWCNIVKLMNSQLFHSISWVKIEVDIKKNTEFKIIESHIMNDIYDYNSYYQGLFRCHILLIFFPDNSLFTSIIPSAAIRASYENRLECQWMVFLSNNHIILFRETDDGVEIYNDTIE
jgi:hypothetical protein